MITATNLSKTFASATGKVHALRDVSFEVANGSFTAVTGKSGSGKSTLLAMLGGLDAPSQGTIGIDEQDITRLHDRRLTRYRGKHIGFVFQSFNLISNLSALENVMLPMEFARIPRGKRKQRAADLLNSVGITDDKQRRKPNRLSGGEQQRVAIARALANRPNVILADEPTGNLDSETGAQVFNLLRELSKEEGTTVILITHDLALAKQCDRMLRLRDGVLEST